MTRMHFIRRSLRHYWRGHLGLLFGAFLASTVLTGSLLVGDSVRGSLERLASFRLGKVETAIVGGDRWFSTSLAQETEAIPLVMANGAVSAATGGVRINAVQVLGVDDDFWSMGPSGSVVPLERGEVAVNQVLAQRLNAEIGDTILVRLERPSAISRDAPLSGSTNEEVTLRRKIVAMVSPEDFGNFQLAATQRPGAGLMLDLEDLQMQIEMDGRVNAMLRQDGEDWGEQLEQAATLGDFSLSLNEVEDSDLPEWQISTDRVFLDSAVSGDALKEAGAHGVLTYLVNGILTERGGAPYSMVSAIEPEVLQTRFGADEVDPGSAWITRWLADDQDLAVGDEIKLRYFVVGLGRELKEEEATFQVAGVLEMDNPVVSRDWTPDFPGVSDVDNCRDWEPGIPMDMDAIRDQDEVYWDDYKGTPKVYIPLAAGQALWENRFGRLTSVRVPGEAAAGEAIREGLLGRLTLREVGLVPIPLKQEAAAAAKGSVDFGGLFVGLSFFLITAALLFAALLFLFTMERRRSQMGLLMSLGWTASAVRKTFLIEAGMIALIGVILGVFGGQGYTQAALAGLSGAWSSASQGLELVFLPSPMTMGIAFGSTLLVVLLTLWWSSRSLFQSPPRVLLTGAAATGDAATSARSRRFSVFAAIGCAVLALLLLGMSGQVGAPEAIAGVFFGAGFLLLASGLLLFRSWMLKRRTRASGDSGPLRSLRQVALLSVVRRPGRSLAVVGMMAAGVFLVTAVNAFRMEADSDPDRRDTGTGGFRLVGESSLPVYEDLAAQAGIDAFGLDEELLESVSVVPFRVKQGDDASCLNLNRAQRPQLVAVKSALLEQRNAFRFAAGGEAGWSALQADSGTMEAIPAIADQATAMWGLGKGVGDRIAYEDASGESFEVEIVGLVAGSILQGKIIIEEGAFLDRYPNAAGYRFFLIDAEEAMAEEVSAHLTRQLEKRGLALEPALELLRAFLSVQNTYIGIFTVLGGLGVLLGSAGLGVLVARHVLERRGELGLMQALGFVSSRLRGMVLAEHAVLLCLGLVLGLASAVVAIWPNLVQSRQGLPVGLLLSLWIGVLLFGLACCGIATRAALRGRLLDAVRRE